eukprot:COSAG02_NODE_278_length_25916_cov_19.826432_6_plen_265_part_00
MAPHVIAARELDGDWLLFKSATAAVAHCGFTRSADYQTIIDVCAGRRRKVKTVNGWTFRYATPEEASFVLYREAGVWTAAQTVAAEASMRAKVQRKATAAEVEEKRKETAAQAALVAQKREAAVMHTLKSEELTVDAAQSIIPGWSGTSQGNGHCDQFRGSYLLSVEVKSRLEEPRRELRDRGKEELGLAKWFLDINFESYKKCPYMDIVSVVVRIGTDAFVFVNDRSIFSSSYDNPARCTGTSISDFAMLYGTRRLRCHYLLV